MGVSFSQQINQIYEFSGVDPGAPLPFATMTFYQAGSLTLKDVFIDKDENTPASNPLTADADGNFPQVFIADIGLYRVQYKNQGGSLLFDLEDVGPDNDLETQVAFNTSNISNLDSRVTTNENDISFANSQISTNTADIATLQTDQNTVEGDIFALQDDVVILQADAATIETEIDVIFTDVSYISFTIDGTTPNVIKSTDGLGISSVVFSAGNKYAITFDAQVSVTALTAVVNSITTMGVALYDISVVGSTVTSINIFTFDNVGGAAFPFSCKMNYQDP